ncbi:MAG: PAS domain-containing hybrid sensor histidine kinase/response regulator [Myxococcota bacterium]
MDGGTIGQPQWKELQQENERLELELSRLRSSEQRRTQLAVECAGLGAWELDPATMQLTADTRFFAVWGDSSPREVWSYPRLMERIHPEDRDGFDRRLRRAFKRGGELVAEIRLTPADGIDDKVVLLRGRLVCEDGPLRGRMVGSITDVSEARRTERALRDSERRYRIMGETVPYGVWRADSRGALEYVSGSFLALVGRTLEEVQGFAWVDVLDADTRADVLEAWRACVAARRPWERELRVTTTDGRRHTILSRGLPVFDGEGRVSEWVGNHLDISQRTQIESELRASRESLQEKMRRLEQVDQRKDEFLAILGHELRNPLAALSNGIQLVQHPHVDAERRAWTLDMVASQVRQLVRIVDDLLDVTRISEGKVRLQPRRLSLRQTLERAVHTVMPLVQEREHRLELSMSPEEDGVLGDESRLEQVVVNLLTNAAKYTPIGGHIALRARGDNEAWQIVVEDSGVGLAPESLEKVFEPFAQVRGSAIAGGGLGIGLTIVKRLVELHGGTVGVSSGGLGRGATFTVTLPRCIDASPLPMAQEATPPWQRTLQRRVLVVDDNEGGAIALAQLLRDTGCEVRTCFCGEEAIAAAREFAPDTVLCDIGLPDVTGLEVARAIRKDAGCHGALLIAVTGFGHDGVKRKIRDAGFDHHLLKPVCLDKLVQLFEVPATSPSVR